MLDFSLRIGGQAGQGLQTIGDVISKTLVRSGYYVHTIQDYLSRVRGGHNFTQVRVRDVPVASARQAVHLLVALDAATIEEDLDDLHPGGTLIYDEAFEAPRGVAEHLLTLPLKRLAKEAGDPVTANTVASGAILGLLSGELGLLKQLLTETFARKGDEVVAMNHRAAQLGHDYAQEHCPKCVPVSLPRSEAPARMLIGGNEALGLGALAAGCRWMSAYPMTPSTGVLNFMASRAAEHGLVVEQAEDEIAAINMAIGASFAGVRALTATSGGGFALMNEGLALAGMTETPLVVVLAQRPGPATGLPTRTGQEELLYALHAGAGESLRVLFAPGTAEEAFYLMAKAFNLAERYQLTVIILSDQNLADSAFTIEGLDFDRVKIDRGALWDPEGKAPYSYERHAFTESGVSPRLYPGAPNQLVVTDSDEHTPNGHITEDLQVRVKMVEKRNLLKLPALQGEIAPPQLYGPVTAEVTLMGWGTTRSALTEAVDLLREQGVMANALVFSEVWPMPVEAVRAVLGPRRKRLVSVEGNATAQFARLLYCTTGIECDHHLLKYDGRPFTADYILRELSGLV